MYMICNVLLFSFSYNCTGMNPKRAYMDSAEMVTPTLKRILLPIAESPREKKCRSTGQNAVASSSVVVDLVADDVTVNQKGLALPADVVVPAPSQSKLVAICGRLIPEHYLSDAQHNFDCGLSLFA